MSGHSNAGNQQTTFSANSAIPTSLFSSCVEAVEASLTTDVHDAHEEREERRSNVGVEGRGGDPMAWAHGMHVRASHRPLH